MLWGVVLVFLSAVFNHVNSQSHSSPIGPPMTRASKYTVEVLVVVDYSAYQQWYSRISGNTPAARKRNTYAAIWKYYSSVVHGVDSIFKGLEKNGLRMSVKAVDIQVVTTGGIARSKGNTSESDTALRAFFRWTQSNTKLPAYDHAVLFSGHDLMESGNTTKSGRAYLSTMCTSRSLSVVENDFSYEIVHITAHEIAHSLGANHDGDGNRCRSSRGYLMASVIEIDSIRRWYFSSCSASYIKAHVRKMTRQKKLCLVRSNQKTPGLVGVSMGELYTPDEQCQLIEGHGSYFCRDNFTDSASYSQICRNIMCFVPGDEKKICNQYEGSDGYVCGDMEVCVKGKCLFQENGPGAIDSCPLGDQPGLVWKNYTCAQMVFHEPEMCYDNVTRTRCCLSCMEIRRPTPGCEYGDKSSWCRTDLMIPMGCYKNEELCCDTCKKHKDTSKPKCQYGDKSQWCKTTLKPPFECYKNEDLCCGTCAQHYNATQKGCEYGDKSTWCVTEMKIPYDCYKNNKLCCSTCPQHHRPQDIGCEYGDRSTWCVTDLRQPYDCYHNRDFCCSTCGAILNTSNVGCEYGDKHLSCTNLTYPVGCYGNDDICCGSCGLHRDPSQPGCEYGDKSTWCSTDLDPMMDCHLNHDLCCDTCSTTGSGEVPMADTSRSFRWPNYRQPNYRRNFN